jgi:formamidopyrimidine-DNA glycosylase
MDAELARQSLIGRRQSRNPHFIQYGRVPELPDIEVYLHCLRSRIAGARLERIRLASPFLLRTVHPPLASAEGKSVVSLRRVGKRIAMEFEGGGLWLVLHLMIAGRLQWADRGPKIAPIPGAKRGLAAFDFSTGTLILTEAGSQKRASLHVVDDPSVLDPGGIEPLTMTLKQFSAALIRENHTLKRVLTDPRVFSGIGNAYSDEILHLARLSPIALSQKLSPEEIARLHRAIVDCLTQWTERLRSEAGDGFPTKVTAFRPEMAMHGKYGEPCPDCGEPVQRIRYTNNETNYCPQCQTGGRLLADRALSRLLGKDFPRTIEDLEAMIRQKSAG